MAASASSEECAELTGTLELFCGIGGMGIALHLATGQPWCGSDAAGGGAASPMGRRIGRVRALDNAEAVIAVYQHNLRSPAHGPVLRRNIETLEARDVDGMAYFWTLSPPCQPFTTTVDAKRLDVQDARNRAFLRVIKLLEELRRGPEVIFYENVTGFYQSETHALWTDALRRCGYAWRQYLLTPVQFRLPNNRMRFYMVARKCECASGPPISPSPSLSRPAPLADGFSQDAQVVFRDVRPCACGALSLQINGRRLELSSFSRADFASHRLHEIVTADGAIGPDEGFPISEFLLRDDALDVPREQLVVADEVLRKRWAEGLSYVGALDKTTFCFTSRYAKTYRKASGSLLHTAQPRGLRVERHPDMSLANSGLVRRFSPRELLNLFCFPDDFAHPPGMPLDARFKTVGQSVNVAVMAALMHSELCRQVTTASAVML